MKVLLAVVLLSSALAACGPRQVNVETGTPPPATGVSLRVTNNAAQSVNVYVTSGGSDIFAGQVGANSTQLLPVTGVSAGSNVTLKARLADGTRTYTKDGVVLSGTYAWQVP